MSTQPETIVKASSVINVNVISSTDEDLGKIEDIMIDKLSGQVHYAVLSFGGFLGLGEKLFALPWNVLRYSPEKSCFVINTTKDNLKNAPGFDKNQWPDMANSQWQTTVSDFYKQYRS